jgi:hypothetical protein
MGDHAVERCRDRVGGILHTTVVGPAVPSESGFPASVAGVADVCTASYVATANVSTPTAAGIENVQVSGNAGVRGSLAARGRPTSE